MSARLAGPLVVIALAGGCAGATEPPDPDVVPRGSRTLSMDVNLAEDGDYETAFGIARAAGAQAVSLAFDWNGVETAPGTFDATNFDIANQYYPAKGVPVGLSLRPLSTTYSALPADLAGLLIDDPAVIGRFNEFVDFVFSRIPDLELTGIYIGSEHDIFLGTDAAAWQRFRNFYAAVLPHVRAQRPGVPVGSEMTYDGLTAATSALAASVNELSDIIVVSHYPLGEGFQALGPDAVGSAFDSLAVLYASRPIVFNQLGYPSSPANGSSEEQQRDFIGAAFRAWDEHADQVRLVNFTWLNDLSAEAVAYYQELYGLHDDAFAAFLGSLGLRTFDGSGGDKLAFGEFEKQAHARGW